MRITDVQCREKAFIVESNRFIREVTVKSCAGGIDLIKFEDGGG